MKIIFILSFFSIILNRFNSSDDIFEGKIIFTNSFTDLTGKDITDKMKRYVSLVYYYHINNGNYKTINEKNEWLQLYNSSTNTYYYFNNDKTANKINASNPSSKNWLVSKLNKTERIAGYECEAIQIETDHTTTVYYFNKNIKVNTEIFSKHAFGEWNKYLEATNGALCLKFIITNYNQGTITTSTATQVIKESLEPSNFTFPKDYTLKN